MQISHTIHKQQLPGVRQQKGVSGFLPERFPVHVLCQFVPIYNVSEGHHRPSVPVEDDRDAACVSVGRGQMSRTSCITVVRKHITQRPAWRFMYKPMGVLEHLD